MDFEFWLGFFELALPPGATPSAAAPLLVEKNNRWAVEVLRDRKDGGYYIFFSTVETHEDGQPVGTCRIGFANREEDCSRWRDRGFPLVDARIHSGLTPNCPGTFDISVVAPYFGAPGSMEYEEEFFQIRGLTFGDSGKPAEMPSFRYAQFAEAPDAARPATIITRRPVTWDLQHWTAEQVTASVTLIVPPSRIPVLVPFQREVRQPSVAYAGTGVIKEVERRPPPPLQRASRAAIAGEPAFRFEDVEAIGFRVDLRDFGREFEQRLERLIRPLNFHLDPKEKPEVTSGRNAMADFRYRPATRTLLIELLRYGKMQLARSGGGMDEADYQGQHELLLRVLVGRVDDDTAQAHEPAVFVPAIFVDNPWSKILGRDLQGFDKRLACFCVPGPDKGMVTLCPDGFEAHKRGRRSGARSELKPHALTDVCRISMANVAGMDPQSDEWVLELDYSGASFGPRDRDFEEIDLDLAMGGSALAGTRWRQTDFEEPEFRRSFARSAVRKTLKGFRSIQAAPIGDRLLDRTWISGTFEVDEGLRFERPGGVAKLSFNAPDNAPEGWKLLCDILGNDEISFASGEWYRMKTSMTFTVDDGLEWDR